VGVVPAGSGNALNTSLLHIQVTYRKYPSSYFANCVMGEPHRNDDPRVMNAALSLTRANNNRFGKLCAGRPI
jgi:hypothetical protein